MELIIDESQHLLARGMSGIKEQGDLLKTLPHQATQSETLTRFLQNYCRQMGNVELFELCETNPKVQCKECILYWNQGIVYCTCAHLLRQSGSSRHLHQWQLDAFSLQNYVIKKRRPRGARHGKTEAQKEHS